MDRVQEGRRVSFESVELLSGLWITPVLAVLIALALRGSRAALDRFAERSLVARVDGIRPVGRSAFRGVLIVLAVTAGILALARPQWGTVAGTLEKQGRDVVFLIDTSRSMLADDLAPNRLERAKLWIEDTLDVLEGDRVALVAFAGSASARCPLTNDYGFFRFALRDISTNSVARGGTNIGDALRMVRTEIFGISDEQPNEERFRDIILITDGEDHESFPVEAASQLGADGVRIICIGIGDEDEGRPIPLPDGTFVRYDGEIVRTKLDGAMLRELALATPGGTYLNVATGTIRLDDVYQRLIIAAERSTLAVENVLRLVERFQIFLLFAIACLALERVLAMSGRRRPKEIRA